MSPEQELAFMISICLGGGIAIRWILEAYIAVFWLFWDIVDSVV